MTGLDSPYIYGEQYLMLPVHLSGFPAKLELDGTTYQVKSEFHCSLVSIRKIIPLIVERDHMSEAEAEQIVSQAAFAIINDLKPQIATIGPELRIASQPDRHRRTIVVMARVPAMEEIFTRLNRELRLNLPNQVGHITLACVDGLPIGITSPEMLQRETRLLKDEETAQLLSQVDLDLIFEAHS